MKNFTNNFKQFTSRLSARWLIMALMLLLGTSSAWGATVYFINTKNWSNVYIHYWNVTNGTDWNNCPKITDTGNTIDGYKVYSYTNDNLTEGASILFKNVAGSNGSQTADMHKFSVNSPYAYGDNLCVYLNAGDYIYFENNSNYKDKNNTQVGDKWITNGVYAHAHIFDGNVESQTSLLEHYQGDIYRVKINKTGYYAKILFTRGANSTLNWNSLYNQTADLLLRGNYAYKNGSGDWDFKMYSAKAGFWGADAWNIKYYPGSGNDKWIDDNIYGHIEANGTAELGTLTGRPYLKGILANVYWTQDVSNVCKLEVTFKDADNTTQSITTFTWRDIDGDNIDKELKTESLNIPLPYSSGNHTVTFTFKATINNNGTSCESGTETTTMTGTITYEIPECSVPDGITIKHADGEKFCENSNVTLSPSVAHVDGYTYAWEVSGTGWSINSGSAARECEVKVGTGEGSVKLTVSNGTCSKEATTLDITPKASTPIATPTISAEKQIICNGNNDSFLSVGGLTSGATYTLVFEGSEQADPAPIPYTGSESVKFAISKAGSYTVVAKTTDTEACQFTARATDEIDFTSISFSQSEYTTTPWVPVSVVVNAPEGTTYEYDDTAITGTTALKDAPIKTVSNNTYTYKLPRPTAWGEGNKTPANEDVDFNVSAKITVESETCNIQSTVKLQDEGNDKCTTNP